MAAAYPKHLSDIHKNNRNIPDTAIRGITLAQMTTIVTSYSTFIVPISIWFLKMKLVSKKIAWTN